MRNVTESDVIRMAGRVAEMTRQAGTWGEDTYALTLDIGSKYYGRAYRLHSLHKGSSGHYSPPLQLDFLGMTKSEAFDRLTTVQSVIAGMVDDDTLNWELVRRVADRAEELGHVGWRLWCERPPWSDDFTGFAKWVKVAA